MQIHKDKKLKLINRNKNNAYLRKIVENLHRLKAKMNQSKKKKDEKNQKAEKKSETIHSHPGKMQELWQNYQEFIGLFKNSPEALVYTDLNGIILEVNNRFEGLSGFSLREARGRYLRDLLKVNILEKKKDQHDTTASEMEIRRKDGKNIYVNIACSSNMIQNKEIGKILLLKEITDRKRSEKVKQILYNISQIANSNASLNELYPMIFKKLKEIIDTSNVYIALFDEDKNTLRFCYSVDETDKKNENLLSLNNNNSKNIFYYIFKTGKSILLNYNKYKKMIREGHFSPHDVITNQQIWLGVPLKVADKTIGSIVLQSYTNPVLYSQKDVKLMEFVAQQIANAILRKTNEEKLKIIHP